MARWVGDTDRPDSHDVASSIMN